MIIRPIDPDRDLDGYLRVLHQAEPFPRTADDWRERQTLAAAGAFRRHLVGDLDGEIVAVAAMLDHDMTDNAVAVRLVVAADHRRRGHGRAMAAALEALAAERMPAAIEARMRDDDPASRAWAERRGFHFSRHLLRSRLDLAGFDPGAHRHTVERAEGAGFRFEASSDADRLYDLYAELIVDTPDGLEPPTRDSFRRYAAARSGLVRLIVREGPTWVGLASVGRLGPDGAWNDFTGVLAEYRGRGLARALKVLAAEEVARQGRRWIETNNNVDNAPMLAVNRALGYRPLAGSLHFRRLP